MGLKDTMLYASCVPVIVWSVYEGFNVYGYAQTLKNDYGDCYKSNPYLMELFFGTLLTLSCLMFPV